MRTSAACLCIFLASECSSDSPDIPTTPDEEKQIAFTRPATVQSRTDEQLEDSWTDFQVTGAKWLPGVSQHQLVFPGYKCSFSPNTGWTYEDAGNNQYPKYWDRAAATYVFNAVAPAPDNSASAGEAFKNTVVNLSPDGEITFTDVMGNVSTGNYTNSSNSPEWMVARTRRVTGVENGTVLADTDLIDPANDLHDSNKHPGAAALRDMTDDVPLSFHRIMAKVDFQVWATSPIILKSFVIEVDDGQPIISKGDYTTLDVDNDGMGVWSNTAVHTAHGNGLTYCNYVYLDGKTVSDKQATPTLLSSHVQIPQEWAGTGRTFKLTFVTTTDEKFEGNITITEIQNQTNSWLQNKHYTYTVKINTGAGDVSVILFAVDMDTWKWKAGSQYEDIQTDW